MALATTKPKENSLVERLEEPPLFLAPRRDFALFLPVLPALAFFFFVLGLLLKACWGPPPTDLERCYQMARNEQDRSFCRRMTADPAGEGSIP